MKMFSNDSDFCFEVPIHEILDQKSLYGRKIFISEKKSFLKIFSKSLLRGDGGGTFRLHFRNLQKIFDLNSDRFGRSCDIG